MIIVERPKIGDYLRMDMMDGFRFKQPFYGEVVVNTEANEDDHFKIKILCGAYGSGGSGDSWSRQAGGEFYLPKSYDRLTGTIKYVYFREPDDEMWAAIAQEALAG